MAQNTATADGGSNNENPAADLDTIVVDPDDVIEAMRRNDRDSDEQRTHVLRVSPPLEGEQTATPYVDEAHTRYPPELSQTPLHIGPETFIVGHGAGTRHPDWRNEWSYPNRNEERSLFRDEFDAYGERGENRLLTDDEEDEWDEWWDTVVEMWENGVRRAVKNTEELTLTSQHRDVEDTTVSVRVEGE
jgi:hypothetical protein